MRPVGSPSFEILLHNLTCRSLLHFFRPVAETYHMIDTCDPLVASWSDGGDSFVIKDVESFSKVRVSIIGITIN